MFKTLSAATLSLSLAMGSLAPTPVKAADQGDLARVLLGVGLLAAIASASAAADDRHREHKSTRRAPVPQVQRHVAPQKPVPPRSAHRGWRAPARKVLPGNCVRDAGNNRGRGGLVMRNCLEDRGVRTARLPNVCERTIDRPGRRHDQTGWNTRCLRQQGYQIR